MRTQSNRGVTITSVLVATALAGVVSAVVAQLITNQSKVMRTLNLREERENLLKHYRNTLISGWDNTLASGCGGALYDRKGDIAVPSGGLTVKSDDLYANTSDADGWWKVSYTCASTSSPIYASDKYEITQGSGLHDETHYKVDLKVEFLKDKHPHVSTKLAERKERFYMHKQKRLAGDTNCRDENQRTRQNTLDAAWGSDKSLYKGEGAIIQYDFETNYTKCSQVPLVRHKECPHDSAIIGFWGTTQRVGTHRGGSMGSSTGFPYVSGDPVCSNDDTTGMPSPPSDSEWYYHPKVDDSNLPTPPHGEDRLITAYIGTGAGGANNLGNFGNAGCQHNSNSSQHTYVSYIDGKGTAYCQTERHVIQNDIRCGFTASDLPDGFSAIDTTVNHWGDDAVETGYEAELNSYGALARGRAAGLLTRKERDGCWKLGRGAFRQFHPFNSSQDPGTWDGHCINPGYQKGDDGGRGLRGANGSGPEGPRGPAGTIYWNRISSP